MKKILDQRTATRCGERLLHVGQAVFVAAALAGCSVEPARIESYMPRSSLPGVEPQEAGERAAGPLGLDACVRIALDNNPMNRAAREGVAAAKAAVGESRAAYYPKLTAYAGYARARVGNLFSTIGRPPVNIGPENFWFGAGVLTWDIFDWGKRRADLKTAMAQQGASQDEVLRVRQELALTVYQAFYTLQVAEELQAVAKRNVERAKDHLRQSNERKEAGTVPQIDVLRSKVDLAQAQLALTRNDSSVRIARGGLNAAMGLPVEMPVEVANPPDDFSSPHNIDLTNAFDQAVHTRPELAAALRRIEAARWSVNSVKSTFLPKISFNSVYVLQGTQLPTDGSIYFFGAYAQMPIFDGFVRVHRLSHAKADLAKEEADTANLVLQVRSEVWNSYSKLKEAYEAIKASEAMVADAEESARSAAERYRTQAGTITEVLDSGASLFQAEASLAQSRWDYRVSKAEFRRAIGEVVTDEERTEVRRQRGMMNDE